MSTSKEEESSDDSALHDTHYGEMKDSDTMIQIAPTRVESSTDSSSDSEFSHAEQKTVTEVQSTYNPLREDASPQPKHLHNTGK